jgi:hypothetical protein
MDVLPYLPPARLSRAGAAIPRVSCPYLAPGSSRAAELFFDARRCRGSRGAGALLFIAARLLWFAPTVSVDRRDPVTRAKALLGNLVEKCLTTRCRLRFGEWRRSEVAVELRLDRGRESRSAATRIIVAAETMACRRYAHERVSQKVAWSAVLSLQVAIITQGDQRVRGVDVECMLAGKNRRPGDFSARHQSAIEPAKVIGAAAQPKLRNEKCGFLAPIGWLQP